MNRKPEVLCVGAAIVDIPLRPVSKQIFDSESYPLDQIRMTIGGDAINEAAIITRLGHRVALMSLVGDDPAGHYILDFCRKNGVDASGVRVDPQVETSINIGLVAEDGERTFVTNRNGSLWKMTADHVDCGRFAGARLLSLASIFNNPLLDGKALVKIFQAAKQAGLTICADMIKPRLGETLADVSEALSYVDYFFPNYEEACLLTGKRELEDVAAVFLDAGVKTVVIKTGKKGCFIRTRETALSVPTYNKIRAIDTIGAGDNFVSGFISGLLEGMSLEQCAQLGNATATVSVQSIGATTGVKNRQQVDALLEEYLAELNGKAGIK